MRRSFMLLLSTAIILCICMSSHALAANLETLGEPVEESVASNAIYKTQMRMFSPTTMNQSILCFDVSSSGLVAVGAQNASRSIVYVLNSSGEALRGYEFQRSGDFGIFFYENQLAIYFYRSELVIVFDDEGNGQAVYRIPPSSENTKKFRNLIEQTQVNKNGVLYELDRDMRINSRSYSRLVMHKPDGTQMTLYDVTPQHNMRVIVGYAGIGLFLIVALSLLISPWRKSLTNLLTKA